MARIFLSYRRSDSITITGRIYDRLVLAFGEDNVFKDVDDIPIGADFRRVLDREVGRCDVLLVIIGRNWLDARAETGARRLDDENDFVRIEVESGLRRADVTAIPVLVSGATMPDGALLPGELRELAYRNAAIVRDDPDFNRDMTRLIAQLHQFDADKAVQAAAPVPAATPAAPAVFTPTPAAVSAAPQRRNRTPLIIGAGAALAVVIGSIAGLVSLNAARSQNGNRPSATAVARIETAVPSAPASLSTTLPFSRTDDDAPRGELAFVVSRWDETTSIVGMDILAVDVAHPELAARNFTDSAFTLRAVHDLAYSPDGAYLAWIADTPAGDSITRQLMIADGDGTNPRVLAQESDATDAESLIAFDWFPDSRRIISAMAREDDPSRVDTDLFVIDVDTGALQPIPSLPDVAENEPDVSPDGAQIVYRCLDLQTGRIEVCTSAIDGSQATMLTDATTLPSANAYAPTWLSDGSIVFYNWDATVPEAQLLHISRGAIIQIAYNLAERAPVAAPTTGDVLYEIEVDQDGEPQYEVALLDISSERGFRTIQSYSGVASLAWSPDSRYFAVTRGSDIRLFSPADMSVSALSFTPRQEDGEMIDISLGAMAWRLP